MIYTIENKYLKVAVNTAGAELYSVYSKQTETEYLWQGDPAYWSGRACNIFPLIGRMYKNTYYYAKEPFYPRIHGLARYYAYTLEERTATRLTFLLTDNEETLKEYPFHFEFRVQFELKDSAVTTRYSVKNTDSKEFGGFGRISQTVTYETNDKGGFKIYLPTYTALVLEQI